MSLTTTENLPRPAGRPLNGRLGLNLPAKWWPTRSGLKAIEAAGFDWIQVHSPPQVVLREPRAVLRHARALRKELDVTGLRLVLHAPDELSVGEPGPDRAFAGLLAHADVAGADIIVYHGANFPFRDSGDGGRRLAAEQRSLVPLLRRAEETGVVVCLENLAPVFPSGPRLCHSPGFMARLVERLASPAAAVCLDVGHAHIASQVAGAHVDDFVAAAVGQTGLFHLHDNLGARRRGEWRPGVEPLRLDLHLPPGEGTLDWDRVAPLLTPHPAPLLLEVHPPHRRQPSEMVETTAARLVR